MALVDAFGVAGAGIGGAGLRIGQQLAGIDTEPHGSAHIGDVALLGHQVDYGHLSAHVELGTVRLFAVQGGAGELDAKHLHAETQTQVGYVAGAGEAGGNDFALYAAVAEPARHDDAVEAVEQVQIASLFQRLGTDPFDVEFVAFGQGGMNERLFNTQVGVLQLDIFADNADVDALFGA